MVVDLVVLAVVALAAWRGWRRGGTALVLALAGTVLGLIAGAAIARWWEPGSTVLWVGGVVVGGLVGLALGRRIADALAARAGGRTARPVLVDRAVGVVAHGGLALVLCVVAGSWLAAVGPPRLAAATDRSTVLATAAAHLPAPSAVADQVPGLHRVLAGPDGSLR